MRNQPPTAEQLSESVDGDGDHAPQAPTPLLATDNPAVECAPSSARAAAPAVRALSLRAAAVSGPRPAGVFHRHHHCSAAAHAPLLPSLRPSSVAAASDTGAAGVSAPVPPPPYASHSSAGVDAQFAGQRMDSAPTSGTACRSAPSPPLPLHHQPRDSGGLLDSPPSAQQPSRQGRASPPSPSLPAPVAAPPAAPNDFSAANTLFISGLPAHIQNGFQLSPFVPSEGLRSLRVKRTAQRDVAFAVYDSAPEAHAALQWFYAARVIRGIVLSTTDGLAAPAEGHARDAPSAAAASAREVSPLPYHDLHTYSRASVRYGQLLRECCLLEAEWARGTPTYHPPSVPTADAQPLQSSSPPAENVERVVVLPPSPPLPPPPVSTGAESRRATTGPLMCVPPLPLSVEDCERPSAVVATVAASSAALASPVTARCGGASPRGRARSDGPVKSQTSPSRPEDESTGDLSQHLPSSTLFVKLLRNFTEFAGAHDDGAPDEPQRRGARRRTSPVAQERRAMSDFVLVRAILKEEFFAERFAGFSRYSDFLRPPFYGGCFVRFERPQDALACLRWLRAQPQVRRLLAVQFARQDSTVPSPGATRE